MSDPLFTPSLATSNDPRPDPFHLGWCVVPAVFGGPVGAAISLAIEARRLRAPAWKSVLVLALAVAVLLGAVLSSVTDAPMEPLRVLRLGALVTLLAGLGLVLPHYRAWALRGRDHGPAAIVVVPLVVGLAVDVAAGLAL